MRRMRKATLKQFDEDMGVFNRRKQEANNLIRALQELGWDMTEPALHYMIVATPNTRTSELGNLTLKKARTIIKGGDDLLVGEIQMTIHATYRFDKEDGKDEESC
jgi:hypothetical protein